MSGGGGAFSAPHRMTDPPTATLGAPVSTWTQCNHCQVLIPKGEATLTTRFPVSLGDMVIMTAPVYHLTCLSSNELKSDVRDRVSLLLLQTPPNKVSGFSNLSSEEKVVFQRLINTLQKEKKKIAQQPLAGKTATRGVKKSRKRPSLSRKRSVGFPFLRSLILLAEASEALTQLEPLL